MARAEGKDRGLFEKVPGSGVWWILYYDRDGKRHREKAGSKSQARKLYALRQGEKLQGKLPAIEREDRLTVRDMAEKYRAESQTGKKPKSIAGLAVHEQAWLEVLGDRPAREVTGGDIEAQKARWLQDLKPATINTRLSWLKAMYNRAVRDYLVPSNPLGQKRVEMMKGSDPRDRIVSPEEERALVGAASEMMGRAIQFALYSGLRQAEQFDMQRADVDLSRKQVRLLDPKSRERQFARLSLKAMGILKAQLVSHRSKWVWPSDTGRSTADKPLLCDTAFDRLVVLATQLGLAEGITWHSLRHTFVSRLSMLGVPVDVIRRLARHKSLATTMGYAHLQPDQVEQALSELDHFEAITILGAKALRVQLTSQEKAEVERRGGHRWLQAAVRSALRSGYALEEQQPPGEPPDHGGDA